MTTQNNVSLVRDVLSWYPEYGDDESALCEARAAFERIAARLEQLERAVSFIENVNAEADHSLIRMRMCRAREALEHES